MTGIRGNSEGRFLVLWGQPLMTAFSELLSSHSPEYSVFGLFKGQMNPFPTHGISLDFYIESKEMKLVALDSSAAS